MKRLAVLSVLFLSLSFAAPAWAQEGAAVPETAQPPAPAAAAPAPAQEEEKKAPMTPEEKKLYDDFIARTQEFHDKPFDDPSLEFSLRLPKTWTKYQVTSQGASATGLTRKLLGVISRFSGPAIGDIRPTLVVEALELEHEITAENWAKNFALTNGFTLRELKPVSEHHALGSYITIENGVPLYIRFSARISGNVMILAQFSVPSSAAEQLVNYMRLSMESFTLARTSAGTIENFKPFSLRDVLSFKYPLSWDLRYPRYDEGERVTIELHNKQPNETKLNGLIALVTVKRQDGTSMETEVARIREDLIKNNDVTFDEMLLSRMPPSYLRFTYAVQEAYKIPTTKAHIAQEIWFTAYEDETWYVFVYLLTPAREETFYEWARNIRAMELVLRSIE